jgi:hypothetical protein
MTATLKDFLVTSKADTDTVQQAGRYYVAERTGDLSPKEIRQRLVEAVGDENAVQRALDDLIKDSRAMENCSLALLSYAWADPVEAERVRSAVADAKTKMPVIEVAAMAAVAMYGMYLVATGGVKKTVTIVERSPNGTLRERTTTEYFGPTGPLSALIGILRKQQGSSDLN